ncbi:hypothetical protein [Clostridium botulinum]|uniref:hypothetical protein n=1 Tax=Clostridium botulinum TaxID=1491 RepID=UPI001E454E4F|nr:hypothetical protein [Clostridium botulinum]MCD3329317.1 hypothetical protein [Clostridium botulinum D/C]MCD3344536.1 hypothetical protein [Clostridium botulinum D/C]MCD3353016.1 hypothetical protein [Clostridium botulinum D/C]
MTNEDKLMAQNIIETAKLLKSQIKVLCNKYKDCETCPFEHLSVCSNFVLLSEVKLNLK